MIKYAKLKILRIVLFIIFIPFLLFYLGIVLPEYLACINCIYEGEMGIDIWGSEIQCFGESKYLGEVFFQMFSLVISFFATILLILFFFTYKIKKELKSNK